ncbi:MAG: monooxygenase [Methyloligellaceae bacterium]
MITAIVRFRIPKDKTLDEITSIFEGTAPKYQGLDGLVRKYYLFDPEGTGGGVYLWESREAAERVYTDEWCQMIADRYGAPPEIIYFETPVIVDNTRPERIAGAAE